MLQSGSTPITNGTDLVTVTFPVEFDSTPPVILTKVRNFSNDAPKLIIESNPIEADRYGFTAGLAAAVDTANYQLDWMAGTSSQLLDVLTGTMGRKLSSYNALTSLLGQGFSFPALVRDPRLGIKLVDQDTFWSAVVQRAAEVPANATDGGRGDGLVLQVDANWLYVGNQTVWGRLPLDTSAAWDTPSFYVPFREGVAAITAVADQITYRINFTTPFTAGDPPRIMATLADTSGGNLTILGYQVTDVDLSGFDITFSSPPETNNLEVYYMARQVDLA